MSDSSDSKSGDRLIIDSKSGPAFHVTEDKGFNEGPDARSDWRRSLFLTSLFVILENSFAS